METWDYRVVHRINSEGVEEFAVLEVFFDDDGEILCYDPEPVVASGSDLGDLLKFIEFLSEAASQPTLEATDMKLLGDHISSIAGEIESDDAIQLETIVNELTGTAPPTPHPEAMKVMIPAKLAQQIRDLYEDDPPRAMELIERLASIPTEHIKKHGH